MNRKLARCCKRLKDCGTVFVALSAVCTVALALAAFCQIRESRKATKSAQESAQSAIDESSRMRFADNMPSFKIESLAPVDSGPGVHISNVGKGPGMLLYIGLSGDKDDDSDELRYGVHHPIANLETVPVTCSQNVGRKNFDMLARAYLRRKLTDPKQVDLRKEEKYLTLAEEVVQRELTCQEFVDVFRNENLLGKQHEYWIQYKDMFGNQYRQYFFYEGKTLLVACYGSFKQGPKFKPNKEFWLPEGSERASKVLGIEEDQDGWWIKNNGDEEPNMKAELGVGIILVMAVTAAAQSSPLLVVMTFNVPPNLDQPITGKLLKQEGMEIRITRESDAQANWGE